MHIHKKIPSEISGRVLNLCARLQLFCYYVFIFLTTPLYHFSLAIFWAKALKLKTCLKQAETRSVRLFITAYNNSVIICTKGCDDIANWS